MVTIIIGTIKQVNSAAGFKTDQRYVIVMYNGDSRPIRLQGDNPFEQPTLKRLLDKYCKAKGADHGDWFLAKTIEEVRRK